MECRAGFKAVEQDNILNPTRPSCLTFSAAGHLAIIEPVNAEKVGTWLALGKMQEGKNNNGHAGHSGSWHGNITPFYYWVVFCLATLNNLLERGDQ